MIRLLLLSLLLTSCAPRSGWQQSNHRCNIGGTWGCPVVSTVPAIQVSAPISKDAMAVLDLGQIIPTLELGRDMTPYVHP